METLWRSCAKACETIYLSYGVLSGVSRGMGILGRVHVPQGEGNVMRRHGNNSIMARCAPFLAWFGLLWLVCGEI